MKNRYLLLILVWFLASKSYSYSSSMTIPITTMPQFNPYVGNDISQNKVLNQIAEGLVALDNSLAPVPLLAKKWSINQKEHSLTFELGQRKFHDGSELVSNDVFNSFVKSRESGSDLTSQIKKFKQCKVIRQCIGFRVHSHKRFTVFLDNTNFSLFLRKLAGIEGIIHKTGKDGRFLGTGPYEIESIHTSYITLKKVSKESFFETLVFKKVSEEDGPTQFKSGDLDTISNVEYPVKPQDVPKNFPYQDKTVVTFGLVLNVQSGIFKDPELRKALSRAIDRNEFLSQYGYEGFVATGLIPKGFIGYKVRPIEVDSAWAKDIVSKKLSKSQRLVVLGLRKKYKGNRALDVYLKKCLANIGLNLKIEYDGFQNILNDFRKNKYDMILKGDGPRFYEPSTVFAPYISDQFINISSYKNESLDQLYYAYEATNSQESKLEILEKMENLLAEDLPVVPLFQPKFRAWFQPNLETKNRDHFSIKFWEFPYHRYGRSSVNQRYKGGTL